MPAQAKLTLQQLAQVALGVPSLNNINVQALQSLIDILLKRLNCENEIVSITGQEAKCVEAILQNSKPSSLQFHDENQQVITKRLELLEALEKSAEKVKERWDFHVKRQTEFDDWQEPDYVDLFWNGGPGWKPVELECDLHQNIACELLQSNDSMKKLFRRLNKPLVDRMFSLELKIERFQADLSRLLAEIKVIVKQIGVILYCDEQVRQIANILHNHELTMLGTMEEIQDIADDKLDKIHIPALQKYIKDNFQDVLHQIQLIQSSWNVCPKPKGILTEGVKCLCCGGGRICAEVGVHTTGMLPNAPAGNYIDLVGKIHLADCICKNKSSNRSPWTTVNYKFEYKRASNVLEREKTRNVVECQLNSKELLRVECKVGADKMNLQLGYDANIYRMEML